jgi:hypothetical protein
MECLLTLTLKRCHGEVSKKSGLLERLKIKRNGEQSPSYSPDVLKIEPLSKKANNSEVHKCIYVIRCSYIYQREI